MDITEFAGPPLPPQFVQNFESDVGSDLDSKQSECFTVTKLKKHLDKRKHKVRAKYVISSSSLEESEPSV